MGKKVVVLIDGQNLYYSLNGMGIKEKDVNWTLFLHDLLDEGDELIRTYWFRPQKIQDTYYTDQNILMNIVYKKYKNQYNNYKSGNLDAVPTHVRAEIDDEFRRIRKYIDEQKKRFSSIEYAYDQLCLTHDNIEIIKTGYVKINPFTECYVGEKGVDISLAVKMISLSVANKCGKIILVSGDFDYAEAIRYVKDNMTKIHVVKLHKGIPPRNLSTARDLSVLADKVINMYESDLKDKYKME